jgi:hypothetical protein
MTISEKSIEEFQKLYRLRYRQEISKEYASEQGLKLLRLLRLIYQPLTEQQFDAIQEQREQTLSEMIKHLVLQEADVIV